MKTSFNLNKTIHRQKEFSTNCGVWQVTILVTAKKSKKIKKEKKKFSARLRFATDVQRRMERSRIIFSAIKICTCKNHSSIQCLVVSQILECSLDWIMLRLCLQNLPHNLLEVSVWFSIREGKFGVISKVFSLAIEAIWHTEIVPSN